MPDDGPLSTATSNHVELISGLTNLYSLLARMAYLSQDQVLLPPHASLPLKELRDSGFSEDLIDLISNLPLLRDEGEDSNGHIELAFASQAVVYCDQAQFDFGRKCIYHGDEILPDFILKLAQSERDFGPHIGYDVRNKTIIEWNTSKADWLQSWKTSPQQPVSEYFQRWMAHFSTLEWLPWHDEFGQNVLPRPKEYDQWLIDPTELQDRARFTAEVDATRCSSPRSFEQLLETQVEVSKAERNQFWSKRLLYEEAGWPEKFDLTAFRRKCDEYNVEWREVADIRKYGPRAHYVQDMEHGRRLREWYRLKAGRYAV